MRSRDVQELGALGMVIVALVTVAWLALAGNEAAGGAMISILAAGTGYFLRGKVQAG